MNKQWNYHTLRSLHGLLMLGKRITPSHMAEQVESHIEVLSERDELLRRYRALEGSLGALRQKDEASGWHDSWFNPREAIASMSTPSPHSNGHSGSIAAKRAVKKPATRDVESVVQMVVRRRLVQNPSTGGYISPSQAARSLPQPVAPATIWRWCVHGITAAKGERVKLPHKRIGGRLFIERAALDAFAAQIDASAGEHFTVKSEPRRSKRAEQRAEAKRKLDQRGMR